MNRDRQNSIQSFAFVLSACIAVGLCCGFASNTIGKAAAGRHEIELESRINLNVAPVESLVRLPGLGSGRALAIVAYRERIERANDTGSAFECYDDLEKVSGIGPRTVQDLREWIKFE